MELPPKKAGEISMAQFKQDKSNEWEILTLLIENENVSTVEVDGVGGTETGH